MLTLRSSTNNSSGLRVVSAPNWGQCSHGIGPSGAHDQFSCITANRLLEQDDWTSALEGTLHGASLTIDHDTLAVCTGTHAELTIDQQALPRAQVFLWRAGQTLTITPQGRGLRWYLAVSGGIHVDDESDTDTWQTHAPPSYSALGRQRADSNRVLAWAPRDGHLRVLPGPEWGRLPDGLPDHVWRVDPHSNGMGLRLNGTALNLHDDTMTSGPVTPGIIQATPTGLIILLRECQTIGGYPRVARVIECDLDRAAQYRPGSPLHLDVVTEDDARDTAHQRQQSLGHLIQSA